jgi:hypothetical protein
MKQLIYRSADKSLARPTSRCRRTESIVSLKIHAILTESLEEHAPSYATVKNWVAQFKRGGFSTFLFSPGRAKDLSAPPVHLILYCDGHHLQRNIFRRSKTCDPRVLNVGSWLQKCVTHYRINTGIIPCRCVRGTIESITATKTSGAEKVGSNRNVPAFTGVRGGGNPVRFTDRTSAQPVWGLS